VLADAHSRRDPRLRIQPQSPRRTPCRGQRLCQRLRPDNPVRPRFDWTIASGRNRSPSSGDGDPVITPDRGQTLTSARARRLKHREPRSKVDADAQRRYRLRRRRGRRHQRSGGAGAIPGREGSLVGSAGN